MSDRPAIREPIVWASSLTVALLLITSVRWVRADAFLDREEAQHVLRALQAYDRLGDASAFRLEPGDAKAYYGWPYYLAVAAAWRTFGQRPDHAILVNLLGASVLLASAAFMAGALGGGRAATVLFLACAPGLVGWTRLHGPAVFVAALVAATGALLLASDGFRRPALALAAGLVASLCLTVKLANAAYLAPVVFLALGRGRRAEGLMAFAAGLFPGLVFWARHHEVLSSWSGMLEGVMRSFSPQRAFLDTALQALLSLSPLHWLVLAAGVGLLVRRGDPGGRAVGTALAAWTLAPLVVLPVATGLYVASHNVLPLLLPMALLAGLAASTVAARWQVVAAVLLLLSTFGPRPLAEAVGWPAAVARVGSAPIWRADPQPDVLGPALDDLEGRIRPGSPSRCGCLPFPPYPVPAARDKPVVLVDAGRLGPENLEAWARLGRRPVRWQFGYVPYGLGCAPFRMSLECASAVIYQPGPEFEAPERTARKAQGRPVVAVWGQPAAVRTSVPIRVPSQAGFCPVVGAGSPLAAVADACPTDFYRFHLEAVGRGDAVLAAQAREAAARRARELEAWRDPLAVVFGELYLARAVAGEGDDPRPPTR